jgi:glycosyltransferase involved in cell wall biosynthesis
MKVAYLINQYPHVSHSFIRREIKAVEACGIDVVRVTVRRPGVALVDPGDLEEERRTRVLLANGVLGLLSAFVSTSLTRPLRLARAAVLAWKFGRRSGRILRSMVYLAEACLLVRWLVRERVEHLHAHFGTNSTDVATFAHALGGPSYSFTVHGPEEFDRPESISLGEKISRAAFVVAISSYGRSQLFRWCRPEEWLKVKVVRCGVDSAFLAGGPLPPAAEPRLVCVGRLAEQKGQLLLIDAAGRLAAEGCDFQLVLAGDGPMRSSIEAAIAEHGLGGRVRITGWLSNDSVRAEMAGARLVVLPSFAEGLPVVLMEALALGRPVVTTYVAGIPELVRNRVNGWLVPAGDVSALADAIAEGLRADRAQLTEMGIAGAAAVRAAHDVRSEAEKLVACFAKVVGGSKSDPAEIRERALVGSI